MHAQHEPRRSSQRSRWLPKDSKSPLRRVALERLARLAVADQLRPHVDLDRMRQQVGPAARAPAWRTSRRSTAGNEPAMCLPHLASARNRARGLRARAGATREPPWRAARRARRRDLQTYPICQPHARGIQRKVPGRNCHKSCRRAARPTQHRRTPAASSDTRRPACDAHVAPTCR